MTSYGARYLVGAMLCGAMVLTATSPTMAVMPVDDNANVAGVVRANNQFAFDLYAALREKDGNLFLSPYSIASALSMTYAGAGGDTAKEMASVLHVAPLNDALHAEQAALIKRLNSPGAKRAYQLAIANRLWGQKGHEFLDGFLRVLQVNYNAPLARLDFADSEAARATINNWCDRETQGKIKDLIPPALLNGNTKLVLTNAIYFKGSWAEKFDAKQTFPETFHLSAGKEAKIPMMHHSAHFQCEHVKYSGEKQLKVLVLPYRSYELSMVVLLPDDRDGLADVEKHLSADSIKKWTAPGEPKEVQVSLPKFKMTAEFELKNALDKMGMPLAFTPPMPEAAGADFSAMDGAKELYIAAVIHKAFVDVNEEGTEAAAATAVVNNAPSPVVETVEFRADHPFVFVIRDNRSESILFMGRMANP